MYGHGHFFAGRHGDRVAWDAPERQNGENAMKKSEKPRQPWWVWAVELLIVFNYVVVPMTNHGIR